MYEPSPFPYHGPLTPDRVAGREELAQDLAERLMERRLTALLGPRRYGKTSLLRRVTADLREVGPETVWIDLYELNSMADLAGAIDHGLAQVQGPVRRALDSLSDGLSFRLGFLGVALTKSARQRPDPILAVRSLLRVLVETAQRHPLIVAFDEFSGIADVKGAAGLLRTELQHHFAELGIVFAGSQPSTMRMLFTDQAQPFFAQADLIELGPLSDGAIVQITDDGFAETGRNAGPTGRRIADFVRGHPQRAMQLADATWRHTEPSETAIDEDFEEALGDVRASVDSGSERLFAMLPTGHQKTLRVLASGGSIYGTAASVLDLSTGTATGAVESLLGNGYLTREMIGDERHYEIVDPLFADWITRRFAV
ncbi:MAG: ATP-binding protein [Ilumatobacter sp.]|nr:ATP-binding protein [Ilumatobacter sp.]